MKYVLILLAVMLTGCASAPVKYAFPDVPDYLMTDPAELKTLRPPADIASYTLTDTTPSDVKLSEVLRIDTENYKISNQYKEQIRALQNWIRLEKELNP